jgi:transposase
VGTPLRCILTGGQAADGNEALPLLAGFTADAVLAEKSYDADYIIDAVQGVGATVVISPKANRKTPRTYDHALYKKRNIIERMFNTLKHFRRIARRYDKLAASFMAWLHIAAITLWLK